MLAIENLTRRYGNFTALDKINYKFQKGLYGLLGKNGAGKTTFLKIICGVISADSGILEYNGEKVSINSKNYKSEIGYLPQKFGFIPNYTAPEFLLYMAALKGIPREKAEIEIEKLLEKLDLKDECKKTMKTLSGGNAQRVGIAQALLGEPDILVLDEPTVGLDPKERIKIRNIISAYSKEHTVIFSTHIVHDISNMAGEIVIMNRGKIIKQGSEKQLYDDFSGNVWTITVSSESAEAYYNEYCVSNTFVNGKKIELRIVSKEKPAFEAIPAEPSLEDLYLYYSGEDEKNA